MKEYLDFIQSKRHTPADFGIEPQFIPEWMFDFQKYVSGYAIKKGRCAVFLDTGLGKTLIEIVTAVNYARHTGKPVLILTPLAVAFQFIKEAEKFGIEGVEYSKDGRHNSRIVICNYERLQHFNPADFDCVILDESSILKNFKGAIKSQINDFMRKVKYRYLFTATPSPNDFIELGTSSEALGYMGYMDMLTKFFKNNEDTISPQNIGVQWRLKGHAEEGFFRWVSSWSVSMRKPSDLGFSDEKHTLPELFIRDHAVKNDKPLVVNGQYQMFNIVARTRTEISAEQRSTIQERCEKAAELADLHDTSVYWCNLNPEADLIEQIDPGAVQIKGPMSIDQKEEILLAFSTGEIKKLITKPKITCFGLNWQHCNHSVFFPGFSYEQYYQAVRRFYRFGQTRPVYIDRVISDGQIRIIQALEAKAEKADRLFSKLNATINAPAYEAPAKKDLQTITLPNFL